MTRQLPRHAATTPVRTARGRSHRLRALLVTAPVTVLLTLGLGGAQAGVPVEVATAASEQTSATLVTDHAGRAGGDQHPDRLRPDRPRHGWFHHRYRYGRAGAPAPGATVVPSPTPGPTGTASAEPPTDPTTSPSATTSPTSTPLPTTTPSAPPGVELPTAASTGVPAGWSPTQELTGDYWVSTPGAVIEDLRLTHGVLYVDAPDVTLRRVELVGARIVNDPRDGCNNGLLLEDVSILRSGEDDGMPAVGTGGYTARNVKIDGPTEGFRVGGRSVGCGPVVIEDSWAQIEPPDECTDWHGDALQGYDGPALTVRNTYLELAETASCPGTTAFFYPHSQGNTSAVIDGLVVNGGGYPFRLGTPGRVDGLKIVEDSWGYGPLDVKCSVMSSWSAQVVTLGADGRMSTVSNLGCTTEDGN